MGRRPTPVLGRNRTSVGWPAGQTGLWAEVPTPKPPPASPGRGLCFVSGVTKRPWSCSHHRTGCFGSVSSSLFWNGQSCPRAQTRASQDVGTGGSQRHFLSCDLGPAAPPRVPGAPFPPRPQVAPPPGRILLLGCWLHPSCGPLTSPMGISSPSRGKKKKLLRSVFGLSDGACFRIQKGLEGFPAWNMGGRPLP